VEKILIIDDQRVFQEKLKHAVSQLGYEATSASNGPEGLDLLRRGDFDLLLLDIVMPDMDGFDVMEFMRNDSKLSEIPVIVISALDGDMDAVVRAIKFGAHDFLPKHFEPVLLEARLSSSLEKKRNRDRELEHLQQVERLTFAASVLEENVVDPKRLEIADIADRPDALGQLARVFNSMAAEIFEREKRLRQKIRTLRSSGVLLAVGVVTGLGVVLSRIAAEVAAHPFGIALWVNIVCATICLSHAAYRGKLPKFDLSLVGIFGLWGLLATVIGESTVFWVAQKLPASIIALILVTEGFMVFAFASFVGIEKATVKRMLGFLLGLIGVSLVIFATSDTGGINNIWIWALVALLAPLGYALRTLLITVRLPPDMDMVAATGFSSLSAIILLTPLVIIFDDFVPLSLSGESASASFVLAIILFGIISAVGVTLRVSLIRSAGAVFASQSSFAVTFAGIAWSMILLGESLPLIAWLALGLLIIGLLLVGPKEEAEEVDPIVARSQHNQPRKSAYPAKTTSAVSTEA
jgi:DNA-binding response OmpR family regulator